ncbi:MAG: polysaccharide pyruvyl transferase family protein [Acidobacteria bacterium]|nr:polysaccharide pyruvyl transferase family protein [Acidobacteriota bacterium]
MSQTASATLPTPPTAPPTRILLVGNAPHRNRGCEAIVRGTMEILEATFGPNLVVSSGVMAAPSTVEAQQARELDPRVTSFSVSQIGPRGSLKWWLSQANARLGADFNHHVRDLAGRVQGSVAALEVGGDNYSLDYGRPTKYMAVDNALMAQGIPVVIWGASVGPFDKDPSFAPKIFAHLKRLDGIFVREPKTLRYLRENGVEHNVRQVADPAFVMRPVAPRDESLRTLVRDGSIGINISPLIARYMEGDLDQWRDRAAELVAAAARLGRPILLAPHVGATLEKDDDFSFLRSIQRKLASSLPVPIDILPDGLSAGESKWLIARCSIFAGARTHATIAALSTAVPTLSLSYSVKALGINEDLFGHQEFCQSIKTLTPEPFVAGLSRLLAEESSIRKHLEEVLPGVRRRVMSAGPLLADILSGGR